MMLKLNRPTGEIFDSAFCFCIMIAYSVSLMRFSTASSSSNGEAQLEVPFRPYCSDLVPEACPRIRVKLLIFGATGGTGRALVEQALEQEHIVTAFARNPAKVRTTHKNLRVVK